MDLGYQQEGMTPARCNQASAQNGHWVRMMVSSERWVSDHARYVATAKHCHELGLKMIVTLTHWRGRIGQPGYQPGLTTGQWAMFAAAASHDLAPYVDAWSPMNEPNHPSFSPAYNRNCGSTTTMTDSVKRTARYRHVKRGRYKRVMRHGHVRYKRLKHRSGHYRRVMRTRIVAATSTIPRPAVQCLAIAARQGYDAAAAQIKRFDPSAMLIIGDTAGQRVGWLQMWYAANPQRPVGNVIAGHYAVPGKSMQEFAKEKGLHLWVTEWGVDPPLQGAFTPWLTRMHDAGVRVLIYYGGFELDDVWRDQHLTPTSLTAAKRWG